MPPLGGCALVCWVCAQVQISAASGLRETTAPENSQTPNSDNFKRNAQKSIVSVRLIWDPQFTMRRRTCAVHRVDKATLYRIENSAVAVGESRRPRKLNLKLKHIENYQKT